MEANRKYCLVLDFDNVINAYDAYQYNPQKYETTNLQHNNERYNVYYDPEVINKINQLGSHDDIDIVWLTTWFDHTNQFEILGLENFVSIKPIDMNQNDIHLGFLWKATALDNYLSDHHYVESFWFDDDPRVYQKLSKKYNIKQMLINPFIALTINDLENVEKEILS